tara:strand:+ start:8392 stop:9792 length:1401 start_codon:yes stop_codon:yes gene_type:complete
MKVSPEHRIPIQVQHSDSSQQGQPIYMRFMKGKWQTWRVILHRLLFFVYFILPWLTWSEQPLLLMDLKQARFYILGSTFGTQDLFLVACFFIFAALLLLYVTMRYGRIWCGFLCPQTMWTFLFILCEHIFEGSRHQRMTLNRQPWSWRKVKIKVNKHLAWLFIAMITSLTFIAYFVPVRELVTDVFFMQLSFSTSMSLLLIMAATYINAGWMREKVCQHLCPYSRFQSVMFDASTSVVMYQEQQGEPRITHGRNSRSGKEEGMSQGGCIDCKLCVQVCPAGIDIRDGLQYECIQCGACIDACAHVMRKQRSDLRLITYQASNKYAFIQDRVLRFKHSFYGILCLLSCIALCVYIVLRPTTFVEVARDRKQLWHINAEGYIENSYNLKISNTSQCAQTYIIDMRTLRPYRLDKSSLYVPAGEVRYHTIHISIAEHESRNPISFIDLLVTGVDCTKDEVVKKISFLSQ